MIRAASSSEMFSSWPVSALVEGVKIGSGRRSESRKPGGSANAADLAGPVVVLQAGAGEEAARDAFHRKHLRFPDQHRAAFELITKRLQLTRESLRRASIPRDLERRP